MFTILPALPRLVHVATTAVVTSALALGGLLAAPAANAQTTQNCQARHTVQRGETLFRIGLRYNVAWSRIATANGITTPNRIFAGQVLCIPPQASATPVTPATPTPVTPTPAVTATPKPPSMIPTFSIRSVAKDQTVTIRTAGFPANTVFTVRMGKTGTQGIGGTVITTTNSGAGGMFDATYTIPAALRGEKQIAIRLESANGYFSYNWFWNTTTP